MRFFYIILFIISYSTLNYGQTVVEKGKWTPVQFFKVLYLEEIDENILALSFESIQAATQNLGEVHYIVLLGDIYRLGLKGKKVNYKKALYYYNKAAANKYALGYYRSAYMYKEGLGVNQNYSIAITLLQKAAHFKLVQAQYELGLVYFHGIYTAKDWVEAQKWLELAAKEGHKEAQIQLVNMYLQDDATEFGFSPNLKKVKKWLQDLNTPEELSKLYARMSNYDKLKKLTEIWPDFITEFPVTVNILDIDTAGALIKNLREYQDLFTPDLVKQYENDIKQELLAYQLVSAKENTAQLQLFIQQLLSHDWLTPERDIYLNLAHLEMVNRLDFSKIKEVEAYYRFLQPLSTEKATEILDLFIKRQLKSKDANNLDNLLFTLVAKEWLEKERGNYLPTIELQYLQTQYLDSNKNFQNYWADFLKRASAYTEEEMAAIGEKILPEMVKQMK